MNLYRINIEDYARRNESFLVEHESEPTIEQVKTFMEKAHGENVAYYNLNRIHVTRVTAVKFSLYQ